MASWPENTSIGKAVQAFVKDPEYMELIKRLYKCWGEIGYPADRQRILEQNTIDAVLGPFKENIVECVNVEENDLKRYRDTVATCLLRVATISTELSLAPYQLDTNLPLIEQSAVLTEKADQLEARRQERMDLLKGLIQKNEHLCRVLGQPEYSINSDVVPSHDALQAFSAVNTHLKHDRDVRLKRLQEIKREISGLMADLERQPTTPLQKRLLVEPESHFLLTDASFEIVGELKEELFSAKLALTEEILQLRNKSQSIRQRLKLDDNSARNLEERTQKLCPTSRDLLKTELERLELLKHQNMKKFICELRVEISEMHEKCFLGAPERAVFTDMTSSVFDEEALERHEAECNRLKDLYKQHSDLFTKVVRREEVWKKKMEMDEKESDPNRFNNRGGQLLRDQQEKAKVEHELKRLDADLSHKIVLWMEEKRTPFLVYGRSYADFIQEQKTAYEAQQARLKQERKNIKEGGGAAVAPGGKRKGDVPVGKSSVQKTIGVAGLMQRSPKMQRTGAHQFDSEYLWSMVKVLNDYDIQNCTDLNRLTSSTTRFRTLVYLILMVLISFFFNGTIKLVTFLASAGSTPYM